MTDTVLLLSVSSQQINYHRNWNKDMEWFCLEMKIRYEVNFLIPFNKGFAIYKPFLAAFAALNLSWYYQVGN